MAESASRDYRVGNTSPMDDDPLTWDTYDAGAFRRNDDVTTGAAGLIGWLCTVAGHPGTWIEIWGSAGSTGGLPRVATIALLAAIDCAGYSSTQAHVAEVLTVGDLFLHHPTGGLGTWSAATTYAIGDIVFRTSLSYVAIAASTNQDPVTQTSYWRQDMTRVAAAVGTHLWERMGVANPTWRSKRYWAVDPTNGLDEAVGWGTSAANAQLTPLKTFGEYRRRIGNFTYKDFEPEVWIMNNVPTSDDCSVWENATNGLIYFNICGVETILGTGTISAVQIPGTTLPTVNDDWTLTDSGLSGTWSDSGPGGSSLVSSTTRAVMIVRTSGTAACAWVMSDKGSKTCRISPPSTNTGVPGNHSSGLATWAPGDTYKVVSFPTVPRINNTYEFVVHRNVQVTVNSIVGAANAYRVAFTPTSLGFTDTAFTIACAFIGTGIKSNKTRFTSFNGAFIGGSFEPIGKLANNGAYNVFQDCAFLLFHGGHADAMGDIATFDCTQDFMQVLHRSGGQVQNIRGNGNTGYIIAISGAGCELVLAPLATSPGGVLITGLTATTSQAKPILYAFRASLTLDYVDLPRFDDTYGSGIRGG